MALRGEMVKVDAITANTIVDMFDLMNTFYENVNWETFKNDLHEKDHCILLFDEQDKVLGFSTQKIVKVQIADREVHGVFSGDTIIHKDHWGSQELFVVFARYYTKTAEQYPEFYWFLISKGYKTYRILPVFFESFYPNYRMETPEYERQIIDAFASGRYGGDYNPGTGVIEYRHQKDCLKSGVADVTDTRLKNRDIQHFLKINPDYDKGYDVVCLASLKKENLKPKTREALLSGWDA